jgi:putative hemolysin
MIHARNTHQTSGGPSPYSQPPSAPFASRNTPQRTLEVLWARNSDDVRAAQRLRYQIFVEEMGAQLQPVSNLDTGLDVDRFDAYCEHLLVRLTATDDEPAQVVGTYRVLTPAGAKRAGGLYSDGEFDLRTLDPFRPRMAELGRACTAPDFRQGGVILMLWRALAEFMVRQGLDTMVGCASVSMADGGHHAASLWSRLQRTHRAPDALTAVPRLPLPIAQLDTSLAAETPALIKGYLRCGAKLLGAPAWDTDFGVADLPLLLSMADLPATYRDRFLSA